MHVSISTVGAWHMLHSRLRLAAPVTRLWIGYVVGWLLVLVVTGMLMVADPRSRARLPAALLVLLALAALYLHVTLNEAIDATDLGPRGAPVSALRRRLVLLTAMASAVALLVVLLPHTGSWWLVMHVIVASGLALPAALAVRVMIVLLTLTIAAAWLVSGSVDPMLATQVAFGASAIAVRQLTVSVAQLRAARQELARAAVDQERLRFARDLHDLLGHSLSVIILKSELAGRLLPASPIRAGLEVADVERAGRDALRQVRRAVVSYRQPVLEHELAGAHELLLAAGIVPDVTHSAGELPPALNGLLAWAVREGVTNVVRHSRARRCEIRVDRHGNVVRLAVNDDGRGTGGGATPTGTGLTGLAERAALLGAELSVGPHPLGGFNLSMLAPIDRTAPGEEP
jgi:two-component system, NarL family, sensor histidine kinase DesK